MLIAIHTGDYLPWVRGVGRWLWLPLNSNRRHLEGTSRPLHAAFWVRCRPGMSCRDKTPDQELLTLMMTSVDDATNDGGGPSERLTQRHVCCYCSTKRAFNSRWETWMFNDVGNSL